MAALIAVVGGILWMGVSIDAGAVSESAAVRWKRGAGKNQKVSS